MKYSIGNKLLASGIVVLLFLVLMIVASQVVGGLFKKTSNDLVIEYNELDAVQELKFSISQLLIGPSSYVIYGNDSYLPYFKLQIQEAKSDLQHCEKMLTSSHDLSLLEKFGSMIDRVDKLGSQLFALDYPDESDKMDVLLTSINNELDNSLKDVNLLLAETKKEIGEYTSINKTIIVHSTITILTLGLIVALVILIGGWVFIKSITKPIGELVFITNKISEGDRNAKVNIKTKDEFHILGESFNKMVDNLEETTVSKDYLNNILKNMFDALIVSDDQLIIRSVNQAAAELLGYSKSELQGKKLTTILDGSSRIFSANADNEKSSKALANQINQMEFLVSSSGKKIPALLSCAELKNKDEKTEGLIIVGHDLTEKHAIEKKLEEHRRQRVVDINEAQEEERLRIATDLHDGLGQMLTAISYSVQDLELNNGEKIDDKPDGFVAIRGQIDKAIRETKNLAQNLIPIVLKDFGLIPAIENLILRANGLNQTKFRFDAFDFNVRIDPKREKAVYRICQESLNNILKHAQAKHASYQIYWQDCSVVLVVEDDGVGFDKSVIEQKDKRGIGLISMKERVLSFGGNFTINSEPGQGTEIMVEIPCPKEL